MDLRTQVRRNSRFGGKKNDKFSLYSRNLKPLDLQFPEILSALREIPANEFLLDGEIVTFDPEGRSSFQLLQPRISRRNTSSIERMRREVPVYYMVFDLIACEGYDLRRVSLGERKEILKALLPAGELLRPVETVAERGREFFELVCGKGLEGIIAKDSTSLYQSRRSQAWLKIKCVRRAVFVIGGYTRPAPARKHFGALLLGCYRKDELVYVGRVGSGFDRDRLSETHSDLARRVTQKCPFEGVPKEVRGATWVVPELVCQVKFSQWTQQRMLRSPIFECLRHDLEPSNCRVDEESVEEPVEIAGEEDLRHYPFLSNLDKVFWPDKGYAKRDLVRYYHQVAPFLLPHLKDRPLNLERYPDGFQGKSFYQKDAPDYFPDWIKTVVIESESSDRSVRHVVCNDRDTLVYLANLACIPLHPWSSRVGSLEHPDYVIIDLDPDETVPFPQVCRLALRVRELLEELDLRGFPKTSGAKGMHILVPLGKPYSYREVRSFGEIIARLAVHGMEEVATLERGLARRKGKIYVDFLQNGRGKTVVSPYCLRARPGAPVSTPLEWSEVGTRLRPDAFHMKNIFRRLDQKGDLFAGVLTRKQSLRRALVNLEKVFPGDDKPKRSSLDGE
ncbi:MAG: DNA ligase D [Acidobacteriota bacterium]